MTVQEQLSSISGEFTALEEKLTISLNLTESEKQANIELRQELKDAQDQAVSREETIQHLIFVGKSLAPLKIPYVWGGESYLGIDCSFFTKFLFGLFRIVLPRTSYEQFTMGVPIDWHDVQPGDLLFFKYGVSTHPTTHVAIFIGNGQMLHTNAPPNTIHVSDAIGQFKSFVGARRVI